MENIFFTFRVFALLQKPVFRANDHVIVKLLSAFSPNIAFPRIQHPCCSAGARQRAWQDAKEGCRKSHLNMFCNPRMACSHAKIPRRTEE